MAVSIKLITGKTAVFELNRTKSQADTEFINGFLYGGMFLLKDLPQHYFMEQNMFPREEFVYGSIDDLKNDRDFLGHTYVPLNEAEMQTQDNIVPNNYVLWLRDPTQDNEANLVNFIYPNFLQGLFTSLDLAKVPYNRVLLHKPIKDGIAYDIKGIALPDLKDIARQ